MRVKDIMYKKLYKVPADTSAFAVAQLMDTYNVGSVLVEQEKIVIGIVTERDLIRKIIAKEKSAKRVQIRAIMSAPLIMINPDADILEAASLLGKYKIKRLVVAEGGKIKGIISASVVGNNLKAIIAE